MNPSIKIPQAVADQLNQKLADWFDFTQDDLMNNRQKKISPAQNRKWWRGLFLSFGLTIGLGVVAFIVASLTDLNKWGALAFIITFGILGISWQILGRIFSRVRISTGTVELYTLQKGVYFYYFLLIDGKKLKLPRMSQDGLFLNGIRYRAYHKAKSIQSIEIDPDSIQ